MSCAVIKAGFLEEAGPEGQVHTGAQNTQVRNLDCLRSPWQSHMRLLSWGRPQSCDTSRGLEGAKGLNSGLPPPVPGKSVLASDARCPQAAAEASMQTALLLVSAAGQGGLPTD